MEQEELEKNLEWLVAEKRKDKLLISELLDQISAMNEEINKQKTKIKAVEADLKKAVQVAVRTEEFDEAISKQKIDVSQGLTEIDKKLLNFEKKFDKQRKDDLESVSKRLIEFQNDLKPIGEIRKTIASRAEDDYRITQKLEEVAKQLPDFRITDEELQKTQKLLEDNYRLDSKQISDLQIEISTLRKRIDEERVTVDSQKEFIRKQETRINELQIQEQLRRQEQLTFIESQSRSHVDRENLWKEWESRFAQVEKLGSGFQAQLIELENTHRSVKKSQDEFDDIKQRLERRINEITEMNRLVEDRFKQEWVSFKADDQKRWTNYSLTMEEQSREGNREASRMLERLTKIEDDIQHLLDSVSMINEDTEKRIKGFLALSNEIMTSFEQTMGKRT